MRGGGNSGKIVALLKRLQRNGSDLISLHNPIAQRLGQQMTEQVQFLLAVFGDVDATAALQSQAKATDRSASLFAQARLLSIKWLNSATDAGAQTKVLSDLDELARENPGSDGIASALIELSDFTGGATDAAKRVDAMISSMRSPVAIQYMQVAQQMKVQRDAAAAMAALQDKPLVISGTTMNGRPVTTADWKGQVVLIDFWATWCEPCKDDLPRLKQLFKTHHDKGLQIVGVNCDIRMDDLKAFLASNPDAVWPQLYDPTNPQVGLHPLAVKFGVIALPRMFLIDRNGVVRSTDARDNFEQLVPKLLSEPAGK
jgi:thiol-disulfide isomerase/thioredoxin